MKKLLTAMLAVAMTVFMAMPAFAATSSTADATGSIKVSNAHAEKTYTAYKVFDVTYDGDGNYSYTIDSSSPWFDAANANYELEQVNGTTTYNVKDVKTSAAAAAKAFNDVAAKPADGVVLTNGEATGLPLGYYFVTTGVGTVCSLTTTNPRAEVVDKNEQPPFEKTVDDKDVNIGQTVNYTITGKVPVTTGYTTYTYKVTDTLTAGLTLNHDVKVMFGDTEISDVAVTYGANGFELTYDMVKYQAHAGKDITITYSAVVNENAVIGDAGNPNAAKLEYSNDPTDTTQTGTEISKETVYSCSVNVLKHKAGDDTAMLAGAKFKLYKMNGAEKVYYKWNATDKKVEWVAAADADELTTDGDGKAQFNGIEAGAYFLTETAAPDGFNKLTSDEPVTITRTHVDGNVVITGQEAKVANSAGTELPSTGDMGTKALYAIGGVMAAGAAIALVARKRASRR